MNGLELMVVLEDESRGPGGSNVRSNTPFCDLQNHMLSGVSIPAVPCFESPNPVVMHRFGQ